MVNLTMGGLVCFDICMVSKSILEWNFLAMWKQIKHKIWYLISEGVKISNVDEDSLMNFKNKWTYFHFPCAVVTHGRRTASCSWRAGMLGPCSASRGVTAVNTSYLEAVGSASDRFMTWAIASLGIAYANFFFLSIWKQFNPRGEVLFQPCNRLL